MLLEQGDGRVHVQLEAVLGRVALAQTVPSVGQQKHVAAQQVVQERRDRQPVSL